MIIFLYISKKSYDNFSRAPIKTKEAYITKAPSQGKIEQKFPIFPLTKALCYLLDTNGPMKSRLPSQVTNKIFHFFLSSKQMCSYRKWSIKRCYSNKRRYGISTGALIWFTNQRPTFVRLVTALDTKRHQNHIAWQTRPRPNREF